MYTVNEQQQIAGTILDQMGGIGRIRTMVNGKLFLYGVDNGSPCVSFKFSGSRKANYCKVIYDSGMDLYTFKLGKVGKFDYTEVYSLDGVYCDMLKGLFESETGLYLSL